MELRRGSGKCIAFLWPGVFLLLLTGVTVFPQKVVDKTVATVSDGFQTEWITLSDLRWELALQPGINLRPASSEDLNAALRRLIDQRIFTLEAKRLPRNPATDKELADEIQRILDEFPTPGEFEARLRDVGFSSVKDESFQQIIRDRISIENYLTFRFRSFIVVTANDEEKHYREVFVPEFRRRYKDLIAPTLEETRAVIRKTLIEQRVEADMQAFLDNAKQRVTVVIISPV